MQTVSYIIKGMHCGTCAILIERVIKKIPGVSKVTINQALEKVVIEGNSLPSFKILQKNLQPHGYDLLMAQSQAMASEVSAKHYLEIGAIFLIMLGLGYFLQKVDLLPAGFGISENMSYGMILVIGLMAAFSTCMAVSGGLLLAISADSQKNPDLTAWQKMRPHFSFNVGRIFSYTLLGGLLGAVGSVFTLSPKATGFISLVASLIMIILGLKMLKLWPGLNRLSLSLPRKWTGKIETEAAKSHGKSSFLFGASTFFLPCGFTQALQLYVLSKGSFMVGALTMLVFSLGTLPALLSIGTLSSLARGSFQKYFVKTAGVLVVILGLTTIDNALALTGYTSLLKFDAPAGISDLASIENGEQIVEMKINGLDYEPANFTVRAGVPVVWKIDGRKAAGCAQVVTVPELGITAYAPKNEIKEIRFTPKEAGFISFSCPMGMTTRGAGFLVKEAEGAEVEKAEKVETSNNSVSLEGADSLCDPVTKSCRGIKKLNMTITNEGGFQPNVFNVKVGEAVNMEIDNQSDLGGCMSTLVLPEPYNVAHFLKKGKSVLSFTPQKKGELIATCSMGIPMMQFNVE